MIHRFLTDSTGSGGAEGMRGGMGRGDAERDGVRGARRAHSHPALQTRANFPGAPLRPWATPGSAPHPCLSPPLPQPVKVMEVLPRLSFNSLSPLLPAAGRSPPGARRWRRALREMAAGPGWVTDRRDPPRLRPLLFLVLVGGFCLVGFFFNYFLYFGLTATSHRRPRGCCTAALGSGTLRTHRPARTDRAPRPAGPGTELSLLPPGKGGPGRERRGGEEGRGERKRKK